jgi:hypothetical protein
MIWVYATVVGVKGGVKIISKGMSHHHHLLYTWNLKKRKMLGLGFRVLSLSLPS